MAERRTQQQRSQAARAKIAQAAAGVFALKGYDLASMEDIRLAAGCSKGGLYHHFPSKATVMQAVIQVALPPVDEAPPAQAPQARLMVAIWTAASRHGHIRDALANRDQATAAPLDAALRAGALLQSLTLAPTTDVAAAARRLGLTRVA